MTKKQIKGLIAESHFGAAFREMHNAIEFYLETNEDAHLTELHEFLAIEMVRYNWRKKPEEGVLTIEDKKMIQAEITKSMLWVLKLLPHRFWNFGRLHQPIEK